MIHLMLPCYYLATCQILIHYSMWCILETKFACIY